MKKTIKVPERLYRTATIERDSFDAEKKTVRMSISSDEPYKRYDWWDDEEYWEVLDHMPGGFDDERLKAGLPILFNHDRNQHLGRAPNFTNDGKKVTVEAKFSDSAFAQEKLRDIKEGVLLDTSVGYSLIDEGTAVDAKDGLPVYRFRWKPFEASLVTIPADISVGVGRQRDKKPEGEPKEISIELKKDVDLVRNSEKSLKNKNMSETAVADPPVKQDPPKIDVVKERDDAVAKERKRVQDISDLSKHFAEKGLAGRKIDTNEAAEQHIRDGKSVRDFQDFVVKGQFKDVPEKIAVPDPKIGMSKKERGRFSICKAILEVALQNRGQGKGLSGIEKEACEASVDQYRKDDARVFNGLCIPDDILTASFAEDRDLSSDQMRLIVSENWRLRQMLRTTPLTASTFSGGGALVATDLLAGSIIDLLRNAVLIGSGPLAITELGGLVGNVAIPKHTGAGTVYWMSEGAAVTESEVTFGQLVLHPHRMGADSSYTKQLLAQASLSVEAFVRDDFAKIMAIEEDRVTLYGQGLNGEPLGIANTSGTLADVTWGGLATWANVVALEFGIENANVRNGQLAIITSPQTKSYLKKTLQVASSTFPIYLWMAAKGEFPVINGVMPGIMNEYPAYATKQVSTNVVFMGKFDEVVKARWAGFDVVVDPYIGKKSETIEVTVHSWLDIGIRHPQAFEISADAPISP